MIPIKVYIYNFNELHIEQPKEFEECTEIESLFDKTMRTCFPITSNIEDADIAFFPVNNGSMFMHRMKKEVAFNTWKTQFINLLAPEHIRLRIPHITVWGYVFYETDISCIPNDFRVISLELSPYHRDTVVVPYILNHQTHHTAAKTSKNTSTYIQDIDSILESYDKRVLLAHIGRENIPSKQPILNMIRSSITSDQIIITNAASDDPFEIYKKSKFSIILSGDTPTRKGFYQSLAAGCIPIIFESTLIQYDAIYNHFFPSFRDITIVIPDHYKTESNIIDSIHNQINSILNDPVALKTILLTMQYVFTRLDYYKGDIPNPIYYSISTIVFPKIYKINTSCFEHISACFPLIINDEEIINYSSMLKSQYSLEILWDNFMDEYPCRTCTIETADYIYLSVFPFLAAWTSRPKFFDIIASCNHVLEAFAQYIAPLNTKKTILFPYADVMWHDERVFLNHPSVKHKLPANIKILAFESANDPRVFPVPYPCESRSTTINASITKTLLSYIGRKRPIIDEFLRNKFSSEFFNCVLINQKEWHSVNTECWTQTIQNTYYNSTFSLHPHGDMKTRRGFYQSLQMNSIPVVFQSNKDGYHGICGIDINKVAVIFHDDVHPTKIIEELIKISNNPDLLEQYHCEIKKICPKVLYDEEGFYQVMKMLRL